MRDQPRPPIPRSQVPAYLESHHGVQYKASYLKFLATAGGGPAFTRIGQRVVYSPDDLDAWIASRSVTLGKAGFRGAHSE